MGDHLLSPDRLRAVLAGLALAACVVASAQAGELQLSRLDAQATESEVLGGLRDADFVPQAGPAVIHERAKTPTWWRVTSAGAIAAADGPRLVLQSPYLTHVSAWVPGAAPSSHALHGADADSRYSARALVIALPQGLKRGESIYLRVDAPAAVPMAASVQTLAQVHRADLWHVAWRSMILTAMVLLAILALSFWIGVGDRNFIHLALTMALSALYLATMGGEIRAVPWLSDLMSSGPQGARVAASLGVVASNLFLRRYLDLPASAPRLDRIVMALTWAMGAVAATNLVIDDARLAIAGNLVVIVASTTFLVAAVMLVARGQRAARFFLVSWLPLIVLVVLQALELMGSWSGPPWLVHALAGSFALAGLLLTLGLSDKMLELRRDRDRVSRQATVDTLTGAFSRVAIEQQLAEHWARSVATGAPLSLAYVDIDRFKDINDGHGHPVGDACLRFVAMRLRNVLREGDALGRLGGDEMLVLMPDTALEEALQVAEDARRAIDSRPLSVDGQLLPCSLSLGVAQRMPGEDAGQLLRRADAALYLSKSAGRNRVSSAPSHLETLPHART
jgi:diguanylate cyclase (GGDEF)-like protein